MEKKRDSFFLAHNKQKKQKEKKNEELESKFKHAKEDKFKKEKEAPEKNEKSDKKPFDKKAYRLKKYSKKYKLEQWEEQRKKRLLRNYYKEVKNEPSTSGTYKPANFEDNVDGSVGRFVRHPDIIDKELAEAAKNKDPFWKAKEKYNKIKQDKVVKQQAIEKAKEEKQKKLQEYKKKKHERFKKLSKKTKKGQPVMTGRLELLLDKIQKS